MDHSHEKKGVMRCDGGTLKHRKKPNIAWFSNQAFAKNSFSFLICLNKFDDVGIINHHY